MCPALFGCYPPYATKIALWKLMLGRRSFRLPFGVNRLLFRCELTVGFREDTVTVAQLHAIPGQDQRIWHLWTSTPWVVHHVPVLWGPCCNRCRFFFNHQWPDDEHTAVCQNGLINVEKWLIKGLYTTWSDFSSIIWNNFWKSIIWIVNHQLSLGWGPNLI